MSERNDMSEWDLVFLYRDTETELYRRYWIDQPLPDLGKEWILLPGYGQQEYLPVKCVVDYQINEIRIRVDAR